MRIGSRFITSLSRIYNLRHSQQTRIFIQKSHFSLWKSITSNFLIDSILKMSDSKSKPNKRSLPNQEENPKAESSSTNPNADQQTSSTSTSQHPDTSTSTQVTKKVRLTSPESSNMDSSPTKMDEGNRNNSNGGRGGNKNSKGKGRRDHRRDLNQNANAKDRKDWVADLPEGTANRNQKSRDGNGNGNGGGNEGEEGEDGDGEGRLPKRKVAVYFGYCGIGYSGLQINPGVKTIEGDIFDAFCKAGSVSKENAINPAKVGLQRAARTDRGVHAAGNLLTLKLILDPPTVMDQASSSESSSKDATTTSTEATSEVVKASTNQEAEGSRLISYVNSLLPPFIRIWGLTRVQNSFNARTSCDSRQYEYLLPTHVFLPPKPGSQMFEMMKKWLNSELSKKEEFEKLDEKKKSEESSKNVAIDETNSTSSNGPIGTINSNEIKEDKLERELNEKRIKELDGLVNHPFWEFLKTEEYQKSGIQEEPKEGEEEVDAVAAPSIFVQDLKRKKGWRIGKDQVERIRTIVKLYEGSHNFHNFTIGKDFKDRSARRFMKELTVGEPQVINGTEWISIKFHGQSFMLHQIRKMIGLVILMARTTAPPSLVSETFGPSRLHIPKAPGLGLLLEQPLFGAYNERIQRNNSKINHKVKDYRKEINGLEIKLKEDKEEDKEKKEENQARIEKVTKQIEWDQEAKRDSVTHRQFDEEMLAFKQTFIYDRMCKVEEDTDEFSKWLNCVDVTPGSDFEFLNPKGIIPQSAIQKGGHGNDKPKKPKPSEASSTSTLAGAEAIKSTTGIVDGEESDDDEDEYLKANQAEYEG